MFSAVKGAFAGVVATQLAGVVLRVQGMLGIPANGVIDIQQIPALLQKLDALDVRAFHLVPGFTQWYERLRQGLKQRLAQNAALIRPRRVRARRRVHRL
jgi:hypothetical protein